MTRRPHPVPHRHRARRRVAGLATLAALAVTAPMAATVGATAANPGAPSVFAPQLITVDTPDRSDRTRLQKLGLDLTEHAGHDYVEVIVHTAAERDALRAAGFTYDVRIENLVERGVEIAELNEAYAASVDVSPLPSGRDTYRTLADYEADMTTLAADFPGHVRMFDLANPTLDGNTVKAVEIGADVDKPASGKPTFLLMGLHHAREWPSGELAMEFAIDLATSFGKDKQITRLLKKSRVLVVPVVNPDGFDLSRTDGEYVDLRALNDTGADPLGGSTAILATPGQAYKRKNCRVVDGQDIPDGSCRATLASPGGFALGVDLNRNYGGFWGGPGAAGTFPNPGEVDTGLLDPTYRGASAFSEPETQNVQTLVRERQVTMMISNHTFSNLILRPNGVAPTTIGPDGNPVGNAPDEKGLKALGAEMSAQNGYANQNSWQLYDTTGTTEDWSYNATGGYGYTFEIGPDEFHPPFPSVVDEYLGAGEHEGLGNRAAYLLALEHAVDTAKHGVLKGKAPKGTTLRLRKDFESPTWESSFEDFLDSTITVGRKGRFSWVVNPSTRPLQESRPIEKLDEEPFAGETIEGGATEPVVGTVDHEYVAAKASDVLRIDLDWPTPDDFDLEVYRKDASGELVEVGSSGNAPGSKEQVQVPDAPAGTYVVRVVNYASVSPSYTVEIGQYASTASSTEGKREKYTLSCEVDGKTMASRKVFIDRGQVKRFNLKRACR